MLTFFKDINDTFFLISAKVQLLPYLFLMILSLSCFISKLLEFMVTTTGCSHIPLISWNLKQC